MKRKHLFILILLFVMLIPGYVNAGYVSSCASINDNDVLNNWGKRGANGQYTRLAAKNVYYCETNDQSTNYNSHGKIFELMLNSPEAGKYRLYCLEQGKNAPITGTLVYQNKKYVGGPACAFYRYNGTGAVIRLLIILLRNLVLQKGMLKRILVGVLQLVKKQLMLIFIILKRVQKLKLVK